MNQRVRVLGIVLLGLAGCMHQQTRFQSDEDAEKDKALEIKTVGTYTEVANMDAVPVSGVGLVTGLEGTGGGAPAGGLRDMLEKELRVRGVPNPREVLTSPDCAMVLVSALVPAGTHKGDPIDVEIVLPAGSKTKSLRGGVLERCDLFTYANAKELAPTLVSADQIAIGHKIAVAQGPLLVGFQDGDEDARLRHGRIWGGGRCFAERPFYLVLKEGQRQARIANVVADRINVRFQGAFRGTLADIAAARDNESIVLVVPPQYRHNQQRFLRVVRLIPLSTGQEVHTVYRHRLEELLEDPARTITAALRLEALGEEGQPILKRALQSKHVLVRFAAAEALAYLNDPACGDELARLAEHQPRLRAFCLTALASLDQAICHVKLNELLASPSAETRYGAFRALRALDEHDPAVQGQLLNDSFWLHHTAPESSPLVHLSASRRAEVVLFGEDAFLVPPFSFLAGTEFTVTAGRDDEHCTISCFSVQHGANRRQCSLKLEDVLRTLAALGGMYPDAVELLRQADRCQCLTCRVAIDALPQRIEAEDLTRHDLNDDKFHELQEELERANDDLGDTPTLYDRTGKGRLQLDDNPRRDAACGLAKER
jgi:flagellar basal body P-ring protein FlgI